MVLVVCSLVRNSVVLAVYLLFSVVCFFTVHEHYVKRLSRHILAPQVLRYSTVLLTTVPLQLCRCLIL
ncbi:hypothetical protein DW767_06345 [Blautia obeum]|uniref:Uncharacterized protein n=1 Tax=Blautia obeum TaxID=40520 RepID=A0A396A8N5_9FIRM|nr:hypothetical protein DXC87_04395 [Blautia obeum]RHK22217.1 hypothetical protein DW074_13445 [Ruminococcus sp. AF46-10NS]RHO86788.1 hypothetical protein DW049_09875 [Ruminococcus sp. AF41-9]RGN07655.1 hypothetical protein DXB81_03875 [Blautia obeum]RGS16900.1 hypothetical protein DWY10_07315 [Blautia obeum]